MFSYHVFNSRLTQNWTTIFVFTNLSYSAVQISFLKIHFWDKSSLVLCFYRGRKRIVHSKSGSSRGSYKLSALVRIEDILLCSYAHLCTIDMGAGRDILMDRAWQTFGRGLATQSKLYSRTKSRPLLPTG